MSKNFILPAFTSPTIIPGPIVPENTVYGRNGDDFIWNWDGSLTGDDIILGFRGNDYIFASSGNDTVYGGFGNDHIYGGTGNDTLYGDDGDDEIFGDAGNDFVSGGLGDDIMNGGSGNDTANYQESKTGVIVRLDLGSAIGEGADTLISIENVEGSEFNDIIVGNNDANIIVTNDGNDVVFAQGGNDIVAGGHGEDYIWGGAGNDQLNGGAGNDNLDGGLGNDQLRGGDGNDRISGGQGNDVLSGNLGADTFVFQAQSNGDDTITDFDSNFDTIDFSHSLSMDNFADVMSNAVQVGNDVQIDLGNNQGTVTLEDVQLASLEANDFIF